MHSQPLVSVVMPAYKSEYIAESLNSLCLQTYTNLELIVCDDSTTDEIREIVESWAKQVAFPVHYSKNEKRLWGFGGVEKGVALAKGEYIKILHDDDLLKPRAIEVLVQALLQHPSASLATSKRERVDEEGKLIADDIYYVNPFPGDVVINGSELVSFLAEHTINFIGEPSCTLCRRADLVKLTERYTYLNGLNIAWVSDLAFYVKLLRMGDLVYLTEPQTQFRVSRQQFSQGGRDKIGAGEQGHKNFRQAIRDLGWFRSEGDNRKVQVAKISTDGQLLPFRQINLLSSLVHAAGLIHHGEASIDQWLAERKLNQRAEYRLKQLRSTWHQASIDAFILDCNDEQAAKIEQSIKENSPDLLQISAHRCSGQDAIQQINRIMNKSGSDWLLVLRAGDELISSGLLMAQIELAQQPQLAAISFDEVYRQDDGTLGAALRPSANLDYLLSFPAGMSKHWLFNREGLQQIGGFDAGLPDAFELDALLRLINTGGLGVLGHIAEPLVSTAPPVLANIDDERKAIEQHLHARGYTGAQLHAPNPGRYQIRYGHPQQPVVSVLLAAGQKLQHLQRCVEGLLGNTSYQNFEILFIQQPNTPADVQEWLAGLANMQEAKLRVFVSESTQLAAQYNEIQQHAIGDYLLFLSPDTAVLNQDWLDEMLNHAQRGEVGVVGAKLLNVDGQVVHAGQILGLAGPVSSPFVGAKLDDPGYMQRLQVDQNLSSVGGDCLLVLHELFVQLDGFVTDLASGYISADLCLRAGQAGFMTVWTPHAQLMLDRQNEAVTDSQQQDVMYEKWLPQLAHDPAYNRNFSLAMPGGYNLADSQLSWRPLDGFREEPIALVHPADLFGCGHYRIIQPYVAMKEKGLIDGAISTGLMHVTDLERYNPDCIVLQRQIGEERLEAMQRMQRFSKAFKVYELDDYLPNLPLKSVHRSDMPKDIVRSLRRGLSFVDRFVVSTQALGEALSGMHGEIVVRENRLPVNWWQGLQTQRRQSAKPRVGWAGGASHTGDLELIADVVRDLADEVEWVFFGMCPDALRPYIHEYHEGVAIEDYPAKLASLNLDLGLAPVELNLFNECKSNLRQLEYGACGIPVICTDIRPYRDGFNAGLPVTLVKNRYKDWVDAIRMHINDLDATAQMGDELQAKVLAEWVLQGEHLIQWRDVWTGR